MVVDVAVMISYYHLGECFALRYAVMFFVNFEHILHLVLVFLLLTLNIQMPAGLSSRGSVSLL